jgi:hypothetical protein
MPDILGNLGNECPRQGRIDEARRYLMQALAAGEAFGERIVLADTEILLGQLEERLGNSSAVDAHFGCAIRNLEEIAMPNRLRDCHVEYAQVLENRGDRAVPSHSCGWRLQLKMQRARTPRSEPQRPLLGRRQTLVGSPAGMKMEKCSKHASFTG